MGMKLPVHVLKLVAAAAAAGGGSANGPYEYLTITESQGLRNGS